MFDQSESLYGTTVAGGAYMLGNVFKLSQSGGGWIYTSVHDFNDASVAGYPYCNVVFDAAGNLYGTLTLGGGLRLVPAGMRWRVGDHPIENALEARWQGTTPEQRSEIARKAANARWRKAKSE